MTYRIEGLSPAAYVPLFALSDAELATRGAVRMTVAAQPGSPCRVSLADAAPDETVILVNHVSQPKGPYRASHAIFVRENAGEPAVYNDETPPVFATRILSLRGFDANAMMIDAALAQPGEADTAIRTMLTHPDIAEIHVHNATRACFSAKVVRA